MVVLSSALAALPLAAQSPRFTRDTSASGQPTVLDNRTGLEWQGCTGGLTGDTCGSGSATTMTWQEALDYCDGLSWGGESDWDLPGAKELRSIVDNRSHNPAIDDDVFPQTASSYHWSSSVFAHYTSYAWSVVFNYGYVSGSDKDGSPPHVRWVRRGP